MRYDASHKEETRKRILASASQTIRLKGPDGVGVAKLMSEAGLTHGGFYAHFKSKEDLVAQTITEMFEGIHAHLTKTLASGTPSQGLRLYIDLYLGREHRDHPETGCPMAALSGDVARMDAPGKQAFGRGLAKMHQTIAAHLEQIEPKPADAPSLAKSLTSEMAGALAMARASFDDEQAESILASSRRAVKDRVGLS